MSLSDCVARTVLWRSAALSPHVTSRSNGKGARRSPSPVQPPVSRRHTFRGPCAASCQCGNEDYTTIVPSTERD
jgi:hypothetical protein